MCGSTIEEERRCARNLCVDIKVDDGLNLSRYTYFITAAVRTKGAVPPLESVSLEHQRAGASSGIVRSEDGRSKC